MRGVTGKNGQRVNHTFFHFYPPSSTPVGWSASYQVQMALQVRMHRDLTTHVSILNSLSVHSLSSLINTCGVAYFLPGIPGRKGKNAQRDDYTFSHPKHTPWVCDRHILLYSPSSTPVGWSTCHQEHQVIQVNQVRRHGDLKCSWSEISISYLREFGLTTHFPS